MLNYIRDLGPHIKAFLLTKFFAYSQKAFFSLLINIYFWRITNDISFLVLYNLVFELSHIVSFFPASKICKEYNRFIPIRVGLLLQFVFLGCILFLQEKIVALIVPVAILGGIAHGFYWSSDNLLKFDLTNPGNRLQFTSAFHIVKKIAAGLMPFLASLIVVSGTDLVDAYGEIFIVAAVLTAFAFISTFFISHQATLKSSSFRPFFQSRKLLKNKDLRLCCASLILRYVSHFLPVLLSLVLFLSSGTELSIGRYKFITVIVAIIANYVVGKYLVQREYREVLVYGGVLDFLAIFILFVRQDFSSILLYGILSSMFSALNNPSDPITENILNAYAKTKKQLLDLRVEYIALRETCHVMGKVIGLGILLLLHYSLNVKMVAIAAALMALGTLLANILLTRTRDGTCVSIDELN